MVEPAPEPEAPQAAKIEGIAGARAFYTVHAPPSIADADGIPAQLLGAIECHDLAGVQRQITDGRQHLNSQVQLPKLFGSRLRDYWRYGHVAYFQHYCSVLHWAVHIASVAPNGIGKIGKSKAAANAIVGWLLQVGANPAVEDGWGHDSRRRVCHLMAPPVPLLGVSIGKNRGCQQNDSLADG